MKKIHRPAVTLAAAGSLLILAVLGCGGGSGKPAPAEYVGSWTGADKTTMTIKADGTASYKSDNATINGGSVTIDEAAKTLKIAFVGMGPTFTIDKPPSGNQMTLSGVVYKKGVSSETSSDDPTSATSATVPSDDELQRLAKKTILDFNDAVQSGDFTDLHSKAAKPLREQVTPEGLRDNFKGFVETKSKSNFSMVKDMTAKFVKPPVIEYRNGMEVLELNGSYPTTPHPTKFVLKYISEEGTWKLIGINIDTTEK